MTETEVDMVHKHPDAVPLHALLVGIDAYPEGTIAGGAEIRPLTGCVRDVLQMRRLLLRQGVSTSRIQLLTSPAVDGQGQLSCAPLPTKANLVAAVRALLAATKPGEQALIHFSGHGTFLETAFPELKADHGRFDAALVPWDAPQPDRPLLRDLELAHLLREFVEKSVFVTLILDSCHGGGLGFRDYERPAGGERLAESLRGVRRPLGDEVASVEELLDTWRWWCQPPDPFRTWVPNWQSGDSGWIPTPRGYALLAACRADQTARETEVEEGVRQGLFTHLLLGVLEAGGPRLTYEELHRRVGAGVLALGELQSPQREGEVERQVFGGFLRPAEPCFRVLRREGRRWLVDAGAVHGLQPGARLRVLDDGVQAHGGTATARVRRPAARAVLVQVEVNQSWAELEGAEDLDDTPEPEVLLRTSLPRLVLEDPGHDDLRTVVRLRRGDVGGAHLAALDAVGRAAAETADRFLRPAGLGEHAGLQVAVGRGGTFSILDERGVEIALRPTLAAEESNVTVLVERLAHLARYRNVEGLRNTEELAELAGRVELEASLVAEGADPKAERPRTVPLPRRNGVYQVRVGQLVCLTLRNHARRDLYCAVFDLRPDGSVQQIHPSPYARPSYLIDKGPRQATERHVVIKAGLPEGYDEGRDVLKLVACVRPVDFRWLQLPPLDAEPLRAASGREPRGRLEALFFRLVADPSYAAPPTAPADPLRGSDDGVPVADEWTTAQVETYITRR